MNGTERLYETDAYLTRCEATVLSARKLPGEENPEPGYQLKLILDRTVFFPEGGGQSSDIGWICSAGNDDVNRSEMLAVTEECFFHSPVWKPVRNRLRAEEHLEDVVFTRLA